MSRLRTLHLGKYYAPVRGGIETVVETLCRGEASWAQPSALVINKDTHVTTFESRDGVAVRRVASAVACGAVSMAPTLPLWLARAEADVMVLHEPNPMALAAYYMARPRIPLVVWYHSEVIRSRWKYELFYRPLLDFALRRATRIVVASPPMRDVEALSPYRGKCCVVPFGLPVERYAATSAIASKAEWLRKSASRPTLLFVGRLVGYKGVDILLRALTGVDANTVIVGEGPLRPALEDLARDLALDHRVRFVGEVEGDDLLAWYHACDGLVLPSVTRQEAFGMVQLEAMLCGRPVVSTELGTGVSWVNQHEQTGIVVKPGDVEELRRALTRLMADAALRQRLGSAARERVESHFTAEKMCSAMRTLYQSLTDTESPAARAEPAVAA